MDLYNKASMVVKNSEGTSNAGQITLGVLQRETLRPLLFSLFIADIQEFLIKKHALPKVSLNHLVEVIMLAFADYMVFFADTPVLFNKVILGLKDYFYCNKLTINI